MQTVRIRKDDGKHLVYFIDIKKLVGVDEVGATIIDMCFNRSAEVDEIVSQLLTEYDGVSREELDSDVRAFLDRLKLELSSETYSEVEQDQLSRPLGVELEITKACNLRCKHCFQKFHPREEMTLENVISILDITSANGVFEVAVIGGEPMCHRKIQEILQSCEERDLAYSMVTNGTLIKPRDIEWFRSLSRLSIMVSLEGVGPIHDAIRGQGTFKKVDRTLRALIEAGVEVETLCTLQTMNLGRYREVADYCQSLGIAINFNLFKPFWPEQASLVPSPEAFFSAVIELYRMRQNEGYNVGLSNAAIVGDLLEMKPRNECRATRSGFAINVKGQMITCPLLETAKHYTDDELPLFDQNFLETWRTHPSFQTFRCNGFKECQARALIFSGNVQGKDPFGVSAFQEFRSRIQTQ